MLHSACQTYKLKTILCAAAIACGRSNNTNKGNMLHVTLMYVLALLGDRPTGRLKYRTYSQYFGQQTDSHCNFLSADKDIAYLFYCPFCLLRLEQSANCFQSKMALVFCILWSIHQFNSTVRLLKRVKHRFTRKVQKLKKLSYEQRLVYFGLSIL